VFFVITLPIIFPAILSGAAGLHFVVGRPGDFEFSHRAGSSTLPWWCSRRCGLGVSPEINVLATITIAVVSLMIVGVSLWMSRMAKLDKAAA